MKTSQATRPAAVPEGEVRRTATGRMATASQDRERVYGFTTRKTGGWRAYSVVTVDASPGSPAGIIAALACPTRIEEDANDMLADLRRRGVALAGCELLHCDPTGAFCYLRVGADGRLAGFRPGDPGAVFLRPMERAWALAARLRLLLGEREGVTAAGSA